MVGPPSAPSDGAVSAWCPGTCVAPPGQPDAWTAPELEITRDLVWWRRRFVTAGRRVDLTSEKGFSAVSNYLLCLEYAFEAFKVDPFPRCYRDSFSPKYRSRWPGQSRLLCVNVLEASLQQAVWMNGHAVELSPAARELAREMRHTWAELGRLLKRLHEEQVAGRPWGPGLKAEMQCCMGALDAAWADFEHAHVMEAMAAEDRARELLAEACRCEHSFSEACSDTYHWGEPATAAALEGPLGELVGQLHRLCAAAHVRSGEPADWRLSTHTLLEAKAILHATALPEEQSTLDATVLLAARAVGAFEAARDYLCGIRHCWELVDGELSGNPGLVERLTRFEESLCAASRYLADPRVRVALRCTADATSAAQNVSPELAAMGADCAADLFLAIPRIVWLGFLDAPDLHGALIEQLLPELFPEPGLVGPELGPLVEVYGRAVELISAVVGNETGDGPDGKQQRRRSLDLLARQAVVGGGGGESGVILAGLPDSGASRAAAAAAAALLQQLEGWSMRLQRRQPEVWNELVAILVQCLRSGTSTERDVCCESDAPGGCTN